MNMNSRQRRTVESMLPVIQEAQQGISLPQSGPISFWGKITAEESTPGTYQVTEMVPNAAGGLVAGTRTVEAMEVDGKPGLFEAFVPDRIVRVWRRGEFYYFVAATSSGWFKLTSETATAGVYNWKRMEPDVNGDLQETTNTGTGLHAANGTTGIAADTIVRSFDDNQFDDTAWLVSGGVIAKSYDLLINFEAGWSASVASPQVIINEDLTGRVGWFYITQVTAASDGAYPSAANPADNADARWFSDNTVASTGVKCDACATGGGNYQTLNTGGPGPVTITFEWRDDGKVYAHSSGVTTTYGRWVHLVAFFTEAKTAEDLTFS